MYSIGVIKSSRTPRATFSLSVYRKWHVSRVHPVSMAHHTSVARGYFGVPLALALGARVSVFDKSFCGGFWVTSSPTSWIKMKVPKAGLAPR